MLGLFPHVTFMVEQDSWLYLCDPENGVLVFDLFGGYARTLPVIGASEIQVRDGSIIYVKDGALHVYDPKRFTTDLPITWLVRPDAPRPLAVRIEQGRLYALFPGRVVIAEADSAKR